MPWARPKPCPKPGCVHMQPCPDHKPPPRKRGRDRRPSAAKRGYDHRWRAIRTEVIARFGGKCVVCGSDKGLTVHHLDHDPSNNGMDNLILLCHRCHDCEHDRTRKGGTP